jgi:hypothetical protein
MNDWPMPELWECEECYDPCCYVATVRLNRVQKETVPRDILEGEAV